MKTAHTASLRGLASLMALALALATCSPHATSARELQPLAQTASPCARPGRAVKIMPLGDSLTAFSNPTFRRTLYRALKADGYNIDFVGTQTDYLSAPDYDQDHEGHGGYIIGPSTQLTKSIAANIDAYMGANPPDVVLLLLGTNDYVLGAQVEPGYDSIAKMAALLDRIHALQPSATILVASLLPKYNYPPTVPSVQLEASWGKPLNDALPNLVAARQYAIFVDMHTLGGFTSADWTSADNIHPLPSGHEKMAAVWHDALGSCLGSAYRAHLPVVLRAPNE